jgi:hypothetical protein
MALQGLRGSGFNPVSGTSFVQQRQNSEMQAQKILDQRKEREDRKKEEEKRQKEADKLLKNEFDQLKTEATFLGLPAGRAVSMSLGSLKGWVKSAREMKVNNERMKELLMKQQKHEIEMKEKQAALQKQNSMRQGAEMAMRKGLPTPGRAQMMPKMSLDQMMGYNAYQQERSKTGQPKMTFTPQGKGGGIMQTSGGGTAPQTKFMQPLQPVMQNGNQIGNMNPNTRSFHPNQSMSGASFQSHNPAHDIINKNTGQVVKQGTPKGGMSPERYAMVEKQFDTILKELNTGIPAEQRKNMTSREVADWTDRKRTMLAELGDLLRSSKPSGTSSPMAQTPKAQQEDPQSIFEQYFTNGTPNANYIKAITDGVQTKEEGKKRKVELLQSLLKQGAIDEQTAMELLKNAPYPAN